MNGEDWLTHLTARSMLVVVRTVTALSRLLDVASLVESDRRVQTRFTVDTSSPARFGAGLWSHLDALDLPMVSWDEAVKDQFDVVIAASENDGLELLTGRVLLVPHGVGFEKYYPGTRIVAGMDPARLMAGDRVIPDVVGLSHVRQRELLRECCPPAAARSRVIGDPTLDRMVASRHRASAFRTSLDAAGRHLVVIASTWGPESLLGRWPDLPDRLSSALPADEYRIVVVMHPGVWAAHGAWQVRAWLSRSTHAGVRVLGPQDGWQTALVAASCVLSDHGSMALYAAALDKPLLVAPGGSGTTVPGSATEMLRRTAGVVDPCGDLRAQVEAVRLRHEPGVLRDVVRAAVTDPGGGAHLLRALLYELLDLAEPGDDPAFPPFPAPPPAPVRIGALIAGAEVAGDRVAGDRVTIVRYPDVRGGPDHSELDYRHLVADPQVASISQVAAATILQLSPVGPRWAEEAAELLRQWPTAVLVAGAVDDTTCRVHTRDGDLLIRSATAAGDPLLSASLVYVRLCRSQQLRGTAGLCVGTRLTEVVLEAC